MFEKVFRFLELQKQEMLRLDEVEGVNSRQVQRGDFSTIDPKTGREIGLREMLYINTLDWIRSQANKTLQNEFLKLSQPGVLHEDTLSTAVATFTTSLLPAVRRIYSSLIAMDLVSVQPLSGPTGYIYWLDHVYTSAHAADGISSGDLLSDHQDSDTYSDSSEQGTIREIQYKLTKKLIECETKKLKADWTIEAEQDLRSQWKLDLEAELMPQLTEEVIREVDRKILAALLAGAANDVEWNTSYPVGDTTTADKRAYDRKLYEAILQANQKIVEKKFVNASWLVTTPAVYTRLASLEEFNVDPLAIAQAGQIGRRYVGVIGNIFKVYVDPWFTANKILLGVKGENWKYAVGYYAPYIPLFVSEKYIISDDFTQFARGAMTRYAYGVLPESSTQSPVKNNGLATVTLTTS